MKIIISPYSQKLTSGKKNPKNYPWWQELIDSLAKSGHRIIQLGIKDEIVFKNVDIAFNNPLKKIEELIVECDTWISVDNFLPHFVNATHPEKIGIVIWGVSDPEIFGYPQNINILKSRENLRKWQFQTWNEIEFDEKVFPTPETVLLHMISSNLLDEPINFPSY